MSKFKEGDKVTLLQFCGDDHSPENDFAMCKRLQCASYQPQQTGIVLEDEGSFGGITMYIVALDAACFDGPNDDGIREVDEDQLEKREVKSE